MGRKFTKWGDIPSGHENPLSYATTSRDGSVLKMVDEAVRHNHLTLAYQSIVPAADPSRTAYYEGLVRIFDASGRVIPARDFIYAIETTETGRIVDCVSLEEGLRVLRRHPEIRLSINMSARSIGYPRWMRSLRRGLAKDPTIAERLILEITESSAMLIPELVINFMFELNKKGISFALDDFGAGFTSLRYLKEFYFDILKIDGEFIRGIASDPDNQVLTKAMIAIAEQFDLLTVAESVENQSDAVFLTDIGVDCLQGYFFGAPTIHAPWVNGTGRRSSSG